jgi:integrase
VYGILPVLSRESRQIAVRCKRLIIISLQDYASAKREKTTDVLDAEELRRHLVELQNPARALVFLTAATGSRLSEALGLKWSDVEIGSGAINLSHVVVRQHVGEIKTEASQKPVPMHGELATTPLEWSCGKPLCP